MALIKCTECGKEFSDKAASCPNCGCPISKQRRLTSEDVTKIEQNELKNTAKKVAWIALIIILIGLVIMGGLFFGGMIAGYLSGN